MVVKALDDATHGDNDDDREKGWEKKWEEEDEEKKLKKNNLWHLLIYFTNDLNLSMIYQES